MATILASILTQSFVLNAWAQPLAETKNSKLESFENRYQRLQQKVIPPTTYQEATGLWKEVFLYEYDGNVKEATDEEIRVWHETKFNLVKKLGNMRHQALERQHSNISFSEFRDDSLFELKIIPKRWISIFDLRYKRIRAIVSGNGGSFVKLLPEVLGLILFFFLPFLVIKINAVLLKSVESLRSSYSNPYQMTSGRQKMAILLQRLGPFIPLVVTISTLNLFSKIIENTVLSELSLLIPFIVYYLYYKIFRQLIINFLIIFSEFAQLGKSREAKARISATTKVLGRFFLGALLSLHLVSSVAGKGLLYQEMYLIVVSIGVILYFWQVSSWSQEIDSYLTKLIEGKPLSLYKKVVNIPVLSFVIRTIAFLFILVHPLYLEFKERLLDFGIGKAIIAKLFRKKLESSDKFTEEHALAELPEDYLTWFGQEKDEDHHLWIESKNQKLDEIKAEVDEWLNDTSEEHSLAIYGDKGIGKTQVLRHLERHLMEHDEAPEVVVASIPPKLSSKGEVLKFIGKLVGGKDITDAFELLDLDKELGNSAEGEKPKKKVVILDDAHNLFLAHFGGLKGIETFFEALNVRTDNIFWVASFNTYSWVYLDQVFYKNKYFRTVFRIRGFSDTELQEYIMRRHERSGYSLSFADIIRAIKTKNTSSEVSYVENMFFRLLWEQSSGNPELAEKLWIKSLKPMFGKRLKVGLPLNKSYPVLHKLADDSFFVYSALARHENLTTNEIIQVTDMKEGVVRHSLRIGLENNFLMRAEGDRRYRFSVEGQYSLLNLLKAKNFIYE